MKRYNIIQPESIGPEDVAVLEVADDGQWVKFKDIPTRWPYGWRMPEQDITVIILEHDTMDALTSNGAIIMEQYTKANPDEVLERAKMFADQCKHGRVWVGTLEGVTEIPKARRVPNDD